jgi:hypothetical protein
VDFLSNRHWKNPRPKNKWRAKEEETEYQRPKSRVCHKYLNVRLSACRCKVRGDAWKREHIHTENWMSDFVTIKYRNC